MYMPVRDQDEQGRHALSPPYHLAAYLAQADGDNNDALSLNLHMHGYSTAQQNYSTVVV